MTYVNRKRTGANGVLLTTANGSYQITCVEDIARLLPPKGADGKAQDVNALVSERSDTVQQLPLFAE